MSTGSSQNGKTASRLGAQGHYLKLPATKSYGSADIMVPEALLSDRLFVPLAGPYR